MDAIEACRLLGLDEDAGAAEIQAAWRRRARALHPDRHGDDPRATAAMSALNAAREVLLDPPVRPGLAEPGVTLEGVFGARLPASARLRGLRASPGRARVARLRRRRLVVVVTEGAAPPTRLEETG